jgi:hypothetical protein
MPLSDAQPSRHPRYAFRACRGSTTPHSLGLSGSCVLDRDAPFHSTPEGQTAASTYGFTICAGFAASGRLAALAYSVSRPLWIHSRYGSPLRGPEASIPRLLASTARATTCVIGISHDELLAVHERDTSFPDAPEAADLLLGIHASDERGPMRCFCERTREVPTAVKRPEVVTKSTSAWAHGALSPHGANSGFCVSSAASVTSC